MANIMDVVDDFVALLVAGTGTELVKDATKVDAIIRPEPYEDGLAVWVDPKSDEGHVVAISGGTPGVCDDEQTIEIVIELPYSSPTDVRTVWDATEEVKTILRANRTTASGGRRGHYIIGEGGYVARPVDQTERLFYRVTVQATWMLVT
jgi:hypothetical protein